jgi:predicted O-methyltransferase YrrM
LHEFPPLVRRAQELAAELGFERSCSRETGRLLHVLAGTRGRMRVAETGTGVGVGAAWIVSALDPSVPFFTAEIDAERTAAASRLFADDENVRVLHGDWHDVLPAHAPFDLLFHDGSKRRPDVDGDQTLGLLAPRGLIVMDDLTPGRQGPDPVREFWLGHPELAAAELAVSAHEAVILAVRAK